jgi:hypothetical protein
MLGDEVLIQVNRVDMNKKQIDFKIIITEENREANYAPFSD